MNQSSKTRTRRDRSLWERAVNDLWEGKRPILSPDESLAAAKKLWRHATGKAWGGKWKLVGGNRHTWPRHGVFGVNPDSRHNGSERGLRDIIHGISHYAHRRLHPKDKPHSIRQLQLEARLTKFAIAHGWHLPKPEPVVAEPTPAPPKPDKVALRYRRMVTRRDKWVAEAERAKRLATKAAREVREYERRHGERLTEGA
jgi:hypothetical protein